MLIKRYKRRENLINFRLTEFYKNWEAYNYTTEYFNKGVLDTIFKHFSVNVDKEI